MTPTPYLVAGGMLALIVAGPALAQPIVKLSKSGICHDASSAFFERTKHFQPFDTLGACLNAGGRLPKGSSSASARPVVAPQPANDYQRHYFGDGWSDSDGNCRNTRHEVLAAQSTAPVRYKTNRQCRVIAGRWISPFTGAVIHDPSKMDIDHVVPLAWAWRHGADQWTADKRERFANDPANLVSVEASLNRQKGADGPDKWLPPANQCQYVLRFLRVAKVYSLSVPQHYQHIRYTVC